MGWVRCRERVWQECELRVLGGVLRGGVSLAGSGEVFYSSGRELRHGFAVRPVVSLKSDVTTDTIPKIADQEEQDWSRFSGGA